MSQLLSFLQNIWKTPKLQSKLLSTLLIFGVYRFLAHIPLPAVDANQLRLLFSNSQFLSLLNVFSGGTLANFSIMAVGISPYITAAIIFQLAGFAIPQIKEMQKEGESGREKLNQYTRLVTVPIAVVQSVSVIALLQSQGLLTQTQPIETAAIVMALVAGAMIMMWLGELVTQHGLGNGISMILLAAIVSQLPQAFSQAVALASSDQILTVLSFAAVFAVVIFVIVFMNESIRKVTMQYARRTRGSRSYGGQQTHLPIRVNVAGVMPIIFAVSVMLVPSFLARVLSSSGSQQLIAIGRWLTINFSQTAPLYMITYFVIVFGFTYFSALLFFDAENISDELKKSGAFIPGIRPGTATRTFLEYVVSRITFAGAVFLGAVALLPSIAQVFTGLTNLAVSGTSVLIVVSVILETAKQTEGMMVEQNYDKYLK